MSGSDVLGSGPEPQAGVPLPEQARRAQSQRRRRRLLGTGGAVVLAAVAALLAARSEPDRRPPAPVPSPVAAPTFTQPEFGPAVLETAVSGERAYALAGWCEVPSVQTCRHQLLVRGIGDPGWRVQDLRTTRPQDAGLSATLHVNGDVVAVVDDLARRAFVSTDGGATIAVRQPRPGPRLAAAPPGAILDVNLCGKCPGLTVLEPSTGRLRPLATQPPLPVPVRSFDERDGVLWAVGDVGRSLVTAVSTDRGRSWRTLPVRGPPGAADVVRISATAGGGAYLTVSRNRRPDILTEFSELWRVDDPTAPGAAWRDVTPVTRPRSAETVLPTDQGLLIGEESGLLWRLLPDGSVRRLPDAVVNGFPVPPGRLTGGPSRMLLAVPPPEQAHGVLLVSLDEGESWQVTEVPG